TLTSMPLAADAKGPMTMRQSVISYVCGTGRRRAVAKTKKKRGQAVVAEQAAGSPKAKAGAKKAAAPPPPPHPRAERGGRVAPHPAATACAVVGPLSLRCGGRQAPSPAPPRSGLGRAITAAQGRAGRLRRPAAHSFLARQRGLPLSLRLAPDR